MRSFLLLIWLSSLVVLLSSKAVLEDNGYRELVVAISPDVPESQDTLDQIKGLMTEASRELFIASRKRAYYQRIKILLPKTWTNTPTDQDLQGEFFEAAEVRVDLKNPVYDTAPYTVRGSGCGEPGSYIHITPEFLVDSSAYGNWGKVIVHEWAKLRWGVFEEHGYPGDPQFPMFFYKTIYTATGPRQVLTPNFCANSRLFGYEQDMMTGGQCTYTADQLPDENCYYYVTEQTSASSSYMALPYLSAVQNFCDATEDQVHDADLPNKQNLYCEGKSTWEVILTSPDFADGNNPPNNNLYDTEPEFIIVGSQMSAVNYVLVMDVSASMLPNPMEPEKGDRGKAMIEAGKRWVKYEIPDSVRLGMAIFSDEENARPWQGMTEITEASRSLLITKLDELIDEFKGKTCIGCGLVTAARYPELLNGTMGGNILLITDGHQQCKGDQGCISVAEATEEMVEKNIRVVTIALGPEADPEIEDLAERTGGKSFYVEDNGSTGSFNDAFGGSSTYQPGDTMGNTDVTVYEADWKMDGEKIQDAFDIDASIGRDVVFQMDVSKEKSGDTDCQGDLTIQFQVPGESQPRSETFRCSKDNYGVKKISLSPAPVGRWIYRIEKSESVSVSIKIKAKSATSGTDPILTKCWIATGGQQLGSELDLKLSVVADVKQGTRPVLGATVKAVVERPSEAGNTEPAIELELFDSGAGADSIKNDGIYARYFTHYTGQGRYNVKCQVVGNEDTQVNEGFVNSKETRAVPMKPGTPVCCGSDALMPGSKLTNTGNFSRSSVGGAFQVQVNITGEDVVPPARVTDLRADYTDPDNDDLTVTISFTAPGDSLDSVEPAAAFLIKWAISADSLTSENFDAVSDIITDQDLLAGSTLNPPSGGSFVSLNIKSELFPVDTQYFLAMRANDSAGNWSPVSKVVGLFYNSRGDITPPSAVTDLSLTYNVETINLQFTAPGDDLDTATNASVFFIRYSTLYSDLMDEIFNTSNAITITEDDLIGGSSLTPPTGGENVTISINPEGFSDTDSYFFAMKTKDHNDNWSGVSNIVRMDNGSVSLSPVSLFIILNIIIYCVLS